MKRIITTTAMLLMVTTALLADKLTMEAHALQAALQIQKAKIKSGGAFVTIGDDSNCDLRTGSIRIQVAIALGATEIRLASSTYNENLVIDDTQITIKGGYDNCTDAENNTRNNTRQTITGVAGAGMPTILITGNTQRNEVNLEYLSIQGGEQGSFSNGGGIATVAADLSLNITDSDLFGNSANAGGGLNVLDGNTDVVITDSAISFNTARTGGGIYCSGTDASILITETQARLSIVRSNRATDTFGNGDGGGALIENGCALSSFIGGPINSGSQGFFNNSATDHGGGIAVKSGASLYMNGSLFCPFFFCIGNNNTAASIVANVADSDENQTGSGGGIYVEGINSEATLINAFINFNNARLGGGIYASDQSKVTIETAYSSGTCWRPGYCSQITSNSSIGGAGIFAGSGADINISNTYFQLNKSNSGSAMSLFTSGAVTTKAVIEGSLIVNNGDTNSIATFFNVGAELSIRYSTIADNQVINNESNIYSEGDLTLVSSIIHNTDGSKVYLSGPGGTVGQYCLMVNETNTLPADINTVLNDPQFINREDGDFHLTSKSPAIDFCDTLVFGPRFNDSDNDPRIFNDPTVLNRIGSIDLGYDETYENDIIFRDGLE